MLTDHYAFDGIYYLDVFTNRSGADGLSTLANVRWAITNWTASRADGNDIVFIYFTSHGRGYNAVKNVNDYGRPEFGGDEGDEILEIFLGQDVNGDGDFDDWAGIDEGLQVLGDWYWDDDLAADLNSVSGEIIFVRQGCLEGNQSCFGGGLIDDISAANRIIMSSSNETYYSMGDTDADGQPGDGYSEWTEAFVDALHYERTYYNLTSNTVIHTGIPVHADSNNDGNVTLLEAWTYAWNNDEARIAGKETPWLDDNGNGLPTFINGADHFDPNDGALAGQVCLEPSLPRILGKLGFTNISESTIETFPPNHNNLNVTLYVELAGFHDQNELSWYHVNTSEYHLLFSGPEGGDGFLENHISKTFAVNGEFGLSFLSPEHRYFTETGRNGDGMKHAMVYVNMDNKKMFLIGFENLFGGGDRDYDDMVISLELSDTPPTTPTMTGPNQGYRFTYYTYYVSANDPENDDIYYELDWGNNLWVGPYGPYPSGANVTVGHTWGTPGEYTIRTRAKDIYGELGACSPNLTVTIPNRAPNTTSISGENFVCPAQNYTCACITTDPDGDGLCYEFDWNDSTPHTMTGLCSQNTTVYASHVWNSDGNYSIRVRARDLYPGGESQWSQPLNVTVDTPPNTPSRPSGDVHGNVYATYSYSTNTTDLDGNNVRYEFYWGSGCGTTTTDWYPSGANATASHSWSRPGRPTVCVRAQDTYGVWSESWSQYVVVNITQNDAGCGGDAGDNFTSATYVSWGTPTYWGTLYASNPTDTDDYYKYYVFSGQSMYASVTPPQGVNFDLQLYNPAGVLKAGSYNGANQMDEISYTADSSGYWRIRINTTTSGEGQYSFILGSAPPGGGGTCPTLFAWNGTAYVNQGVMNIHNPSGEDVLHEALIKEEDVSITNYKATFRLTEGWLGLNFSESVIDQVKLYVVDSYGNRYLCPLINATHSRLGNVWLQLLFSDNWKTNLLLLETVDLTFLVPYQNVQSYVFVIEGCNQYKQ